MNLSKFATSLLIVLICSHTLPAKQDCGEGPPLVSSAGADNVLSRNASYARLTNAWNHLIEGIRDHQTCFSGQENDALDAILMQIQSGLILVGLIPKSANARVGKNPQNALRQFVPNTVALRDYLNRERLKRPNERTLRALFGDARVLAEEASRIAPVVPIPRSAH